MALVSVGDKAHGLVTHVEFDSTSFYLYFQFCEAAIADCLAQEIENNVLSEELAVQSCYVGDFVLALFSEDGAWYRAEVRSIDGDAVSVFFVDYGNSEIVKLDNIRSMPSSLVNSPRLASKCKLLDVDSGYGKLDEDQKQSIKDRYLNEELTVYIANKSGGTFCVQLNEPTESNASTVLGTLYLKSGSKHLAYISFIDSPNKFWIQLAEHESSLNSLMDDIANHVQSGAEPLTTPSIGTYCLGTFSEDDATYRSVVLTSTGGKCLVQFVDYGNSESKSAADLMVIPNNFKVLPIQGIKCCYKSTKIKPSILEDRLQELASSSVSVTVVSRSSDGYTVEIDEIERIAAASQNGYGGEVKHDYPISELELNSVYDICLSYVCHPGKFYVQLIDKATTIDEMMDLVAEEYITSRYISHPQRGQSCLAKLNDDQCYRCMIKDLKGEQVNVCAVDFGFEELVQVSTLKEISTNNQSLPVQCLECTVDVTKLQEDFWSTKEVKILKGLESQVPLVAKVTTVRGSVYQLDLYDTRIQDIDRYINAELLGISKCSKPSQSVTSVQKSIVKQICKVPPPEVRVGTEEMVCVTAFKSKTEFYGQLTKFPVSKFASLQELLSETYEKPQDSIVDAEVGTYCCAKYEDGAWYRAIITNITGSLAETSFTDFGDSATQPIKSLKQLLPTAADIPQLCILCQLNNVPQKMSADEISALLLNKVIELKLMSKMEGVYPSFKVDLTGHHNNHSVAVKLNGSQAPRLPRLPNVATQKSSSSRGSGNNQDIQLSVGNEEEIMVTHVIDPEHFHCQLSKMATQLDELMEKLHTSCCALGETDEMLEEVTLGQNCAAMYSDDQVWYRAKITGLLAKGLVEVLFFDYGNTECVPREKLKKLKSEFLSFPPQAVFCGMSGVAATQGFWSPEHIAQFEDLVLDQTFQAMFKTFSSGDDLYIVELKSKGENINQKFGESTHSVCQSGNRSVTVGGGDGMDMRINVGGPGEWTASGGRDNSFGRKPSGDSGFGGRDRFGGGGNKFGSNQRSGGGGGSENWGDGASDSRGFGKQSFGGGGFNRQDRNVGSGRFGNRDNNSGGGNEDWGDGGRSESKGFGGRGFNRQDKNVSSGHFGNRDNNSGGGNDDWGNGGSTESRGFGKSSFGGGGGFNKQDRNVGSGRFGNRDSGSGGFGSGGFNRRDNDSDRGSSGGFGGRSGGGGGRACHKCGEEGHFARECPNSESSGRGGGGGRACHKCGEEGHFARECPNSESSGRGGGGGRACHKCGKEGHFARECPNSESKGRGRGCHKCGEEGHFARECPRSTTSGGGGGRGCHKCGQEGHFARECPNSGGQGFGGKSEGFGGRSGGFGGRSGGFGAKSGGFGSGASNTSENAENDWGDGVVSTAPQGQSGGFGGKRSQESDFGGRRGFGGGGGFESGSDNRSKSGFGGGRKPDGGFGGRFRDGDSWNAGSSKGGFGGGSHSQGGFGSPQRDSRGFGSSSGGFGGSAPPSASADDWESETTSVTAPSLAANTSDDAWQHDGADSFTLAKLKVGETLDLFVVYINNPGEFWCQVSNTYEKLETMMDTMNEEYNKLSSTELEISSPEVGMPCIAMFSGDELWYRAEIIGLSESEEFEVQFVDYGNVEMVSKSKIKMVKPEYLRLPSQGVRCCLHGVQPNDSVWTDAATKQFESLTLDKKLTANVKNYKAGLYMLDLDNSENKTSIGVTLSDDGHCVIQSHGISAKPIVVANPYPNMNLSENTTFEGFVSWIDNPVSFWVQPSDKGEHLDEFVTRIQEKYSNDSSPLTQVSVGMAVVALYSEDGAWYRAYVEKKMADKFVVRFVDYGNSDTVAVENMRQPTPDLLEEPSQALQCSLTGILPLQADTWNVDAKDIMDSLVKDAVTVALLHKKDDVWQTTVKAGDIDITEELVGAAVVRKEVPKFQAVSQYKAFPEIAVGESVLVYVSQIDSLDSFYCQLSKNLDDLDQVMGKIEEYCSVQSQAAHNLTNNMPCLAKFNVDEMWYRAEVEHVYPDGADVHFVDYGNSEKVSSCNIYNITDELLSLSPQAIHCTLSPVVKRSSGNLKQFQNIVLDKEMTLVVISVADGLQTVTLYDAEGQEITDLISKDASKESNDLSKPEISIGTETFVYTSAIETPSKFYLHFAETEDVLTEISTKLEETYSSCGQSEMSLSSINVGEICCAKYSEDEAWYRARIESINEGKASVRFVDYGNLEEVDVTSLKTISPDLSVWRIQAMECKLSGISAKDGDWSDAAIEEFENMTMNQKLTCTFINSCEVSLMVEDGNIGERLISSGFAVKQAPAPPTVACSIPTHDVPVGQTVTVFTSVVNSPGDFYIQLSEVEGKLSELSEKLEEKFSADSNVILTSPAVGQTCCTKFSEDGAWYRSKIEKIEGNRATVMFVDYGNSEDVELSELMLLPEEFCKDGPLAYKCHVDGVVPADKTWTDEAIEYFKSQTVDLELNCNFISHCSVKFENADGDIGKMLVSLGHAIEQGDSLDQNDQPLHFAEQPTPSDEIKMFVSNFKDGTFYLQSEKDEALLGELIEMLQTHCPSGNKLDSVTPGSHCCSLFPADNSWYRAVVTSVTEDQAEVYFVDFGNTSFVSVTDLRQLTPEMLSSPLAFKCCLSECTTSTTEECTLLKSLIEDQSLTVTFEGRAGDTHLVKLMLDDGRNVQQEIKASSKSEVKEEGEGQKTELSDSMIETDLREDLASKTLEMDETHLTLDMTGYSEALSPLDKSTLPDQDTSVTTLETQEFVRSMSELKYLTLSQDDRIQVTVSHVTCPSAFYIQLKDNKVALETFLDEMFELFNNTDSDVFAVKDPSIDMVCAAKYSQDASWYRARIRKVINDDRYEVQFLDHGNTDVCHKSDLRRLPAKFAKLPLQAVACTLGGVRATDGPWSDDAILTFTEVTQDKSLLADVVKSVGDDCYLVQLLDMGISVSETLKQRGYGIDAATPIAVSRKTRRVFSDSSDVAITPKIVRKLAEEAETIQEQVDLSSREYKRLVLEDGNKYGVTISHFESPSLFWCQLVDNASDLDKMMDDIQEAYKEETTPIDFNDETVCVVKHIADGLYYRACVEFDAESIFALFVDYGIFEEVSKTDLRPIKDEFLTLPVQAFVCAVSDIKPSGLRSPIWDEAEVEAFEEFTCDKELSVCIDKVVKDVKVYVQLYDGDTSIGQELVDKGFAAFKTGEMDESCVSVSDAITYDLNLVSKFDPYRLISLEEDTEHCVKLTEFLTPTLFYLHLCENGQYDSLQADITKYLDENKDSKLAQEDVAEGMACLAWSETTGTMERAKVLNVVDTQVEVFLVDTGKSESVPLEKCHRISEDLKLIPAQAVPCGLTDLESESETGWTEDALSFVKENMPTDVEEELLINSTAVDNAQNGPDYLSNTPVLHMYVRHVIKEGFHLITIGCESEDVNRLMVDLGFAKAQSDTTLYLQVHGQLSDLEQSFDELSMNRQNSFGSSQDDEDVAYLSTLDTTGHSVCNCSYSVGLDESSLDTSLPTEDTTGLSAALADESALETTDLSACKAGESTLETTDISISRGDESTLETTDMSACQGDESALETTDLSACQGDESVLDTTSASDSFNFVNLKNRKDNEGDHTVEVTDQSDKPQFVCEDGIKEDDHTGEVTDQSDKPQFVCEDGIKEDDHTGEVTDQSDKHQVMCEDSTKEDDHTGEVTDQSDKHPVMCEDSTKDESRDTEDEFFDAESEEDETKTSAAEEVDGNKVEVRQEDSDIYVNASEVADQISNNLTIDDDNAGSNDNECVEANKDSESTCGVASTEVDRTGDSHHASDIISPQVYGSGDRVKNGVDVKVVPDTELSKDLQCETADQNVNNSSSTREEDENVIKSNEDDTVEVQLTDDTLSSLCTSNSIPDQSKADSEADDGEKKDLTNGEMSNVETPEESVREDVVVEDEIGDIQKM